MGKILTIGELMIRLTPPGKERLHRATVFKSYYGGAEANVAVSLAGFGHESAFLSALPNNELGKAAIRHLRANDVNTDWIYRSGERLGLYYYEEGYSVRPAKVIYDRKHSSIHELPLFEVNWKEVFKDVDILHITGITPALGKELKEFIIEAAKQGSECGVKVSFDFNYRSKLWTIPEARETFLAILPYVSICFAGYKDFNLLLNEAGPESFHPKTLQQYYEKYSKKYAIDYLVCTDRRIIGGQKQELSGWLYRNGELYETPYFKMDVLERIGGGDAFAAGVLHGILTEMDSEDIIHFGVAASVLKHTIYGDDNQVTVEEVKQFMLSNEQDISR
ncbi:PfkB family carbohydrate kinase [Oceanobacillus sp. CAU 1775]